VSHAVKADVTVELNDRVFTLHFDFNALSDLEESLGKPLPVILGSDLMSNLGVSMMRRLMYFGLRANHGQELTDQDAVGRIMNPARIGDYGNALGRALSLSMTGPEPKDAKSEEATSKKDPPKMTSPGNGHG